MKKIKLKYYFILSLCSFMCWACEDLTDIQQEYLDRGEQIYVGKVDGLACYGGYYRIRINGLMHYANTAEKCVIKWVANDIEDSVTINAAQWKESDILNIYLNDMPEETYRFFVQTFDKEGNKSLNEEINGRVYGDNHILSITPKIITRVRKANDNIILTWTSTAENVSYIELKYETNEGVEQQFLPPYTESDTIYSNWKSKGKIEYRTASIPEVGAIDTLYTEWRTDHFPE
jgi:hypothetical protein